jgi:hypothetical protein
LSRRELAFDLDGQTLTRILIQQRHHFQHAPLVGPIEE